MRNERDILETAPTSIAHLIGQRSVLEQVRVALDAAFADNRPFDHALLVGPPGLGKSQTAKVVSLEMATGLHEVLGQTLATAADLNALLLAARDKDVVFIDEAALIPSDQQHALLVALDQRKIFIGGGKAGRAPQSIPLARFTLLLATTHEHHLIPPLIDRMRMVLRYEYYEEADLVRLVGRRAEAAGWWVEASILPQIARRSRGTPRLALRLLQACHRVCRADGEDRILPRHFFKACELEQIDTLGLDVAQQRYLSVLADGPTRLNVLASHLGLPTKTVADVIEPYLIRSGLIVKDEQGRRQLTARGRDHMALIRPIPALNV